MKVENLLKVLDMDNVKQFQWLLNKNIACDNLVRSQVTNKIVPHWIKFELGHLAFRMRNQGLQSPYWQRALLDVHQKVEGPHNRTMNYGFWFLRAEPIHWIIAALIANESED